MKKLKRTIRAFVLCFAFWMILCLSTEIHAAKYLNVTAEVKSKTTVEIRWSKKSVSGYVIYRSECDSLGNVKGYQKIADVSGKKTKYIDKTVQYKKQYSYKVRAYRETNNKRNYKFQGEIQAVIAMRTPYWDEYLYCDGKTTPDSIQLKGFSDGIMADAFEIYRKEETGKYKKIKTVKAKGRGYRYLEYSDKTVTKGKTYSYKIRTYKKLNGKKIYSKYSNVIKLTAVNRDASYTILDYTKTNGMTKSIIVGLRSDEGNGDTLFISKWADSVHYEYRKKENEDYDYKELVPVKYSYDNENWNVFPDKGIKILEHQVVYILLEAADGKEFDFFSAGINESEIYWYLYHNNRNSILTIDFINLTAGTEVDGEMYH